MNSSGYIREAVPRDLTRIIELERRCFTEQQSYSKRLFRHLLLKANSTFLVEIQDNIIQGFIIIVYRKNSTVAGIETIDVNPDFRRNGMGHRLLQAAEQEMKKRRIKKIRLEVSPGNKAAIRLYENEGFKKISLLKNYYLFDHDGYKDAYRMIKELP